VDNSSNGTPQLFAGGGVQRWFTQRLGNKRQRRIVLSWRAGAPRLDAGAPPQLVDLCRAGVEGHRQRFNHALVRRLAIPTLQFGDVRVMHTRCRGQLSDGDTALAA
jgi:hypothetical protein